MAKNARAEVSKDIQTARERALPKLIIRPGGTYKKDKTRRQ